MEDQIAIPGFENYSIHNTGYVINTKTGRKLKPELVAKGYCSVTLSNHSDKLREYIHRLVGKFFIPNPLNKPFINHIDGNRLNNHYSNLEWSTPKENINHAYKIGLCPTSLKAMQGGKLNEDQVLQIRKLLNSKIRVVELAKIFDLSSMAIYHIKNRKTWNHI